MNNDEARAILREHLATWRARSWSELRALIGEEQHCEVEGPSGVLYQLEVNVFWDDEAEGDLRVHGSIDDGGWRAFIPLCDGFIMAPDGMFVGEEPPTA
jgi:hypothetical protein